MMEKEIKTEVKSEILSAINNSTSDVAHSNLIKKEFVILEPHSYGRFADHAIGSTYTGTNLNMKMEEEVKHEVASETLIPTIVDSTSDVPCLTIIKKEYSPSDSHSCGGFLEHDIVKYDDTKTSIQSLDLQKLEVPNLKCAMKSGDDDIYINFEPLRSEELHIKDEVEESLVDDTISCTQDKQFQLYQCDICDYSSKWSSKFQRHLNKHIGKKLFECSLCNCTCAQKSDMQRHMKTHTGEKPFKCSECEYKCLRKSALQEHMKTHTGEKLFKCSVCDYRFIQKRSLQQHIQTHTGEKRFQCNVCNYRSIQKRTLQLHIKKHTGDKPFQCYVCNYGSVVKASLVRHMKTHTGDNTFQCVICNFKFKHKSKLQKHMKMHIGSSSM